MMKVQKFGIALIAAALVVTLSGCNLFVPKITDDNADTKSDSTSTERTTEKKEDTGKKEENKTVDYTAQLVGTYELDHEELTSKEGTHQLTHEQYQATVDSTGLRFTLELFADGSCVMKTPDLQNKKLNSSSFKWKTVDGKSVTFTDNSGEDPLEGKVNENGQITLEVSDDEGKITMVFSKVSDKPGYYSDSSKN